jgi:protein-disulfide isomerase
MKNFISSWVLFTAVNVAFFWATFAYTPQDISNAQYLANNAIIKTQKSPILYRMDDYILRQEVIGIALKMKWITLPENYSCRKYFSDATTDDWVCRAVELAADNGIISRANTRARPTDKVTRAEALAILLKTGRVSLGEPRRVVQTDGTVWSLFQDLKNLGFTQWQADMIDSLPDCSLMNHGESCEDGSSANQVFARFQPNISAVRSSVFEFAALMMWFQAGDDLVDILDDFEIFVNTAPGRVSDGKILSSEALKTLLTGEPIDTVSKTPEVAMVVFSDLECPFCIKFFNDVVLPITQSSSLNTFLVYKHYPLIPLHENAYQWSVEAKCIEKNLGDEDFFHYIYNRQAAQNTSISILSPRLTEEQLSACMEDADIMKDISDDQLLWRNTYNVQGTPTTLVINMKTHHYETIMGAQPKEFVEAVIQSVKDHQ